MKSPIFHTKTVEWLRDSQCLHTTTRPGDILDDRPGGGAVVHGYFAQASRAADLAFSALCACVLGAVLVMFNLPGVSPTTVTTVRWTGYGANVAGVGCAMAAEVERRRKRTRAVIELRAAETVTETTIGALAREAGGGNAWLVAQGHLSGATIERAKRDSVRCFALVANDFVEIDEHDRPLECRQTSDEKRTA